MMMPSHRPWVLMVSPSAPVPPDTGGRLRIYHQLRFVAQQADVTLCTLVQTDRQRAALAELAGTGVEVVQVDHNRSRVAAGLHSLARRVPFHVARYQSRRLSAAIDRVVQQRPAPDLVWCHFLHTAPMIRAVTTPMLVDLQNLDDLVWDRLAERARNPLLKWYAAWNAGAWRRFQDSELSRFRWILAPSGEEQAELIARGWGPERVLLAPNGVPEAAPVLREALSLGRPRVLFCAAMHVRMNAEAAKWFVRLVWPSVRDQHPNAELWLVGGEPARDVRELATEPGVVVTGWVDDVRPFYAGASVAVVPLRLGGGTKIKTLEAMNFGVPVVATSVGVQGLSVVPGIHALVEDEPHRLADAIGLVLRDRVVAGAISHQARQLVVTEYRWDVVLARLWAHLWDGNRIVASGTSE